MKRKLLVVAVTGVATVSLAVLGVVEGARRIESRRVADARPAFEPLMPLRPEVFSQPVAFSRYCRYVLMFQRESRLTDENASRLLCLNHLPEKNSLDVTIHTPRLTDASVEVLKRITTIDLLDVTGTSISDAGIASLQSALPNAGVVSRAAPIAEQPHATEPAAESAPSPVSAAPAR